MFGEVTGVVSGLFMHTRATVCATDYVKALMKAPRAESIWILAGGGRARPALPGCFQVLLRKAVWSPIGLIERVSRPVTRNLLSHNEGTLIVDKAVMLRHGKASVGVSISSMQGERPLGELPEDRERALRYRHGRRVE